MKQFDNLTILAIDTSCDDTCIAIVEFPGKINYSHGRIRPSSRTLRVHYGAGISRGQRPSERFSHAKILSNIVSSQVKLHEKYGGVYPTLAKREHQKNLPIVLKGALQQAQGKQIDLIAITVGPGLEPCLWTGVNFARNLNKMWGKLLIPVNHIEAHILTNFINLKSEISNLKSIFPAVCLVVSGGHTQLILMGDFGKYEILGETRDDAAGECLDKTARILGLGYPGGPAIAKIANTHESRHEFSRIIRGKFVKISDINLPRPMINQKNFDFSFSGLKTAVLYDFQNRPPKIRKSGEYIQAMATEIQQAIIDVLLKKTMMAAKKFKVKSIILGGGVAANNELRKQFNYKLKTINYKLNFLVPPKNFCTDNAVMVGITGYFHYSKGESRNWQKISVNANLRI